MKKTTFAALAALLGVASLAAGGCSVGGTDASVANDIRSETMNNKTSGPPVSSEQADRAKQQGANIPAAKP